MSIQSNGASWPRWVPVAFVIVVTVIEMCRWGLAQLLRQNLYHFDACQHVWWTYRYADPALFPNDPIADYMSRPTFATYGFKFLYAIFTRFIDAQRFSEILPFVTCIPIGLMAFHIGRRVGKGTLLGGFIALFLMFYEQLLRDTNGGFPRSFGVPLLLFGMWMLIDRYVIGLGIALVIAAFMYPPVLLTLGLTTTIVMSIRLWRERRLPPRWPALLILGLGALVLVGSVYARKLPAWMGPKVTRAQAQAMPEFNENGRTQFFHRTDTFKSWKDFYFTDQRSGIGMHFELFAWAVFLSVVSAIVFRGSIPIEAWAMVIAALFLWLVAHLTLFTLYLPNRQTIFAVPIFGMIWMAALAPRVIYYPIRAMRPVATALSRRWVQIAWATFALALFGWFGALSFYGTYGYQSGWEPRPPAEIFEAYAFLRTLPKDTLVAAHPLDADHVPLLSRRSALAFREVAMPYHLGFYAMLKQRLVDELAACYAPRGDWDTVDALYEKYGVDVFLVSDDRYSDPRSISFHEPFTKENYRMVHQGNRAGGFALRDAPPPDRVLWKKGEVTIIRLGPPREPLHASTRAVASTR